MRGSRRRHKACRPGHRRSATRASSWVRQGPAGRHGRSSSDAGVGAREGRSDLGSDKPFRSARQEGGPGGFLCPGYWSCPPRLERGGQRAQEGTNLVATRLPRFHRCACHQRGISALRLSTTSRSFARLMRRTRLMVSARPRPRPTLPGSGGPPSGPPLSRAARRSGLGRCAPRPTNFHPQINAALRESDRSSMLGGSGGR